MVKRKEVKQVKLGSIQYVHNPAAAEKWFALYLECLYEKMMQSSSKINGQAYIENEKDGDDET